MLRRTFWAPRRTDRHLSAAERLSSHPWPAPNCPPPPRPQGFFINGFFIVAPGALWTFKALCCCGRPSDSGGRLVKGGHVKDAANAAFQGAKKGILHHGGWEREVVHRGTRHLQAAEPRRRGGWGREGAHWRCVSKVSSPPAPAPPPPPPHHHHHHHLLLLIFTPVACSPNAAFQGAKNKDVLRRAAQHTRTPLHPAALASVPYGIVLVRVRCAAARGDPDASPTPDKVRTST